MSISAYPLQWPDHIPRATRREDGRFKTSLTAAIKNVKNSVSLFGNDSGRKVENFVVSSNVTLGVDKPADPGVAIWFVWDGMQVCIPVDRYSKVESNLQAIHHIIEARRVELRHGTLALVRATFKGFLSLPSPSNTRPWRTVMGFGNGAVSADEVIATYRKLAGERHPDRGGSDAAMAELNAARDAAMLEVGAK